MVSFEDAMRSSIVYLIRSRYTCTLVSLSLYRNQVMPDVIFKY